MSILKRANTDPFADRARDRLWTVLFAGRCLRILPQRPEMHFGVGHAAGLIQIKLEIVALFREATSHVVYHAHRERAQLMLALVGFREQRHPRVSLIP